MAFKIKSHKLTSEVTPVNFVKSPNTGGALEAKFLVIHYTASGPNSDIARYFARDDVNVSAHLGRPEQ